jgi:hypothetical protein
MYIEAYFNRIRLNSRLTMLRLMCLTQGKPLHGVSLTGKVQVFPRYLSRRCQVLFPFFSAFSEYVKVFYGLYRRTLFF